MSRSAAAAAPPAALRYRLRAVTWAHPEWWVAAVAAAAWVALAYDALAPGVGHPAHHDHGGGSPSVLAGAALMSVAMMGPLVLPVLRRMSLTSLWHRRHRVQVMFLAGYTATWTVVILGLAGAAAALEAVAGSPAAIALLFAGAALWQYAPVRRRALQRCTRSVPIPPRGWRADARCARFGCATARSCVTTCAGMMVALAATGHALAPMLALSALQLHERVAREYRPSHGSLALCAVGAFSIFVPGLLV